MCDLQVPHAVFASDLLGDHRRYANGSQQKGRQLLQSSMMGSSLQLLSTHPLHPKVDAEHGATGMVLPFTPAVMTFTGVNYFADPPPVSPAANLAKINGCDAGLAPMYNWLGTSGQPIVFEYQERFCLSQADWSCR